LQLLVPGETAAPGTATGKTGTPIGQNVGTALSVTVNGVDANWNLINTVTDLVGITSVIRRPACRPTQSCGGNADLRCQLRHRRFANHHCHRRLDGSKTRQHQPGHYGWHFAVHSGHGRQRHFSGYRGRNIHQLDRAELYGKGQRDVGTGTIILNAPSGLLSTRAAPRQQSLLTGSAAVGTPAIISNGVAKGTAVAMTSVTTTQWSFTVTSSSINGVIVLSLAKRAGPSGGGPRVGQRHLRITGTASMPTVSPTRTGTLREVAGAASQLAIQTQPSRQPQRCIFAQQPVVLCRTNLATCAIPPMAFRTTARW